MPSMTKDEKGPKCRVYLKIKPGEMLSGCGSWGEGATEAEARKIARQNLRVDFGRAVKTEETIEWIRREVAHLGPISVTVEDETDATGSTYLDFWHDDREGSLLTIRIDENAPGYAINLLDPDEGGTSRIVWQDDDE